MNYSIPVKTIKTIKTNAFEDSLTEAGINESQITQVYYGGNHVCRCGCQGKYYVPGDAGFKRTINKLRKMTTLIEEPIEMQGRYINIPTAIDNKYGKAITIYID